MSSWNLIWGCFLLLVSCRRRADEAWGQREEGLHLSSFALFREVFIGCRLVSSQQRVKFCIVLWIVCWIWSLNSAKEHKVSLFFYDLKYIWFSVNKNNRNTTFCSEFSAFLKPFSVNCDWRMLILNMIWAHLNCTANKFQAILSIVCFHWTPSKFYTILRSVQRMLTMPVHLMEADLRTSQPTTSVKVQIGGHRFGP